MTKSNQGQNSAFKIIFSGVFVLTWLSFALQIIDSIYSFFGSDMVNGFTGEYTMIAILLSVFLIAVYGYIRSNGTVVQRAYAASLFGTVNFMSCMSITLVADYFFQYASFSSGYIKGTLAVEILLFIVTLFLVHRIASQLES